MAFPKPPPYVLTASIVLGALALLLIGIGLHSPDRLVEVDYGDRITISLEGEEDYATFRKRQPKTITGRVVSYTPQSHSISSIGAYGALSYITEEQYQHVIKKYHSMNRCPASYYNKKRKTLFFVAAENEIKSVFGGKKPKRSAKFSLSGRGLKLTAGKLGGYKIKAPRNIKYFKISSFEQHS